MMFRLYVVLLMQVALSVAHDSLRPRADLPPLQTLTIPLKLTTDRKYLVGINMSPGPNVQRFHFAVTTGTGYSMVAGDTCDSCNIIDSSGYNQSMSATAESLESGQNISWAGESASGNVIKEDCTLNTTVPDAPWVYPNQSIIVANQSDSFSPGMTGVFGLGTNGLENDFNSTVINGWLTRNPARSNFSYGMMLNGPEDESSEDGGVLHWIAPDQSSFDNENVVWKDMVPMNSTSFNATGLTYDFYIKMDRWTLSVNNLRLTLTRGGDLVTVLDPIVQSAIFPQEETTLIYDNVPNAIKVANTTISNVWSVPCDATLAVEFTFGGLTFHLDEKSLITRKNGQCFGTIEEWSEPSATEYLLGSSLISKLYLMFVISGSASGQVGFANRMMKTESNTGLSGGQIAGISVGSAAFVALVALVAFLLYRRRRNLKTPEVHHEHERTMSAKDGTPTSAEFNPYTITPYQGQSTSGQTSPHSPHGFTTTSHSPPPTSTNVTSVSHSISYSNTVVGTDMAVANPDSPPPYLNSPGSGAGSSVRHMPSGETVLIGPPPGDRKRLQKQG